MEKAGCGEVVRSRRGITYSRVCIVRVDSKEGSVLRISYGWLRGLRWGCDLVALDWIDLC